MNSSERQANGSGFGQRKESPVITLTANGRVRKFTINPITFTLFGSVFVTFFVGYLAATAYLVLRDDLIGATIARNARMQHTYEDRIAALRSKIDRITSRQLIDQKAMESRLKSLVERQKTLGTRQGIVAAAYSNAGRSSIAPSRIPRPSIRPVFGGTDTITTGSINPTIKSRQKLSLGSLLGTSSPFSGPPPPGLAPVVTAYSATTKNYPAFSAVENSLFEVEQQQLSALQKLKIDTQTKARKLVRAIARLGVKMQLPKAIGGPSIELKGSNGFATEIHELDEAVSQLNKVRMKLDTVPLGSPVPGQRISSRYGSRRDPFTRRWAMHSGMDFKASYGYPVRATANWCGHQGGASGWLWGKWLKSAMATVLKTRYAHMQTIKG